MTSRRQTQNHIEEPSPEERRANYRRTEKATATKWQVLNDSFFPSTEKRKRNRYEL